MHRPLNSIVDRLRRRTRNEGGYALLEVMIATLLTGILLAGLAGWSMTSMATVSQIRGWGIDESAADTVNRTLTSDAATALAIVSSTTGSPMTDCPGGLGAGGATKIVMVTATRQRIVYSLAADSSSVTSRGQTLFRRVCPNNAVTGSPDFTQTDPLLTTTTSGSTSADSLANGVETATAVCTAADGFSLDPDCQTIRLTIESANSSQANIVAVATRRSDSYCRPGCKPEARFTFAPTDVQRNVQVSFDPSSSRDLRGGTLVEFEWNFDRGGPTTNGVSCGSGIGGGPSQETTTAPTVLTRTFTTVLATCPAYQAGLRVKNGDGVWSDWYEVAVAPRLRRPRAQITAPAPPPINVVENKPVTFQGTLTSYEEPLSDAGSSWDFGDGSAPVAACSSCGNSASSSVSHTFTTVGQYQVKLVATDQFGLTSTAFATVNVRSGKVFVRTGGSTDASSCGALSNPCAKVADAVNRAYTQTPQLTDVLIAGPGPYEGFEMRQGISVTGGYDNDFQVPSTPIATVINKKAGGGGPVGVTAAGLSPATVPVTKLKNLTIDVTGTSTESTTGVSIANSVGMEIEGITVVQATGLNATGLLVTGSTLTISNSNIASGAAQGAGSSAYGIRAIGGSNVTVTNSVVSASAGIDGSNGPAAPAQATSGCNGSRGADASGPSSPGAGGAGGGCGTNGGGSGGTGGNYSGAGQAGSTGAGGGGSGGNGGCGSVFGCGTNAVGGQAGGSGAAGTAGAAGGNTPVAADLWTPTNGGAGTAGQPGSGGGGGGGGKSASASGGGGGGGGAGGNGGAGGTVGGGSGGGSFGIYVRDASVTVNSVTVTSAAGGNGGVGQAAGRGGDGGNGGNGGLKSCCSAGGGGGGGGGGAGGGGGGAGGGAGGPSIAILHIGSGALTVTAGSQSRASTASAGGAGGGSASASTPGTHGSGTQDGGDGVSSSGAVAGVAGLGGPSGQLFRIWDNGTTTS